MTIQLTELGACEWCEKPIDTSHPNGGRRRRYCSNLCRDAAYTQRKRTMPGRNEKRCPDCYLVHAGECI